MKEGSHRPVLLVGSVPLKPASEVFRVATRYLGEVMANFPTANRSAGCRASGSAWRKILRSSQPGKSHWSVPAID